MSLRSSRSSPSPTSTPPFASRSSMSGVRCSSPTATACGSSSTTSTRTGCANGGEGSELAELGSELVHPAGSRPGSGEPRAVACPRGPRSASSRSACRERPGTRRRTSRRPRPPSRSARRRASPGTWSEASRPSSSSASSTCGCVAEPGALPAERAECRSPTACGTGARPAPSGPGSRRRRTGRSTRLDALDDRAVHPVCNRMRELDGDVA